MSAIDNLIGPSGRMVGSRSFQDVASAPVHATEHTLSDLPSDVLRQITKALPPQERGNMRLLNRETHRSLDAAWDEYALKDAADVTALVARFPQTRTLDFSACPSLSNAALEIAATLPALTHLRLARQGLGAGRQITDFSALAKMRSLRSLNVEGIFFDERAIRIAATLPELRFLGLRRCTGITDDSLATVATLPNVESLDLAFASRISDQGIHALASAPKLRALNLQGGSMMRDLTASGLASLRKTTSLEFLNVTNLRGMDDAGAAELSSIASLVHLCLPMTRQMTARSAELLGTLPRLESLHLSHDAAPNAAFLLPLIALERLRQISCYHLSPDARRSATQAATGHPPCTIIDHAAQASQVRPAYAPYLANSAWRSA